MKVGMSRSTIREVSFPRSFNFISDHYPSAQALACTVALSLKLDASSRD
jgi:hypothetical protein